MEVSLENGIGRRDLLKQGALVAGTVALSGLQTPGPAFAEEMDMPKVYFTKDISGKIAIKLHSGEPHGPTCCPSN